MYSNMMSALDIFEAYKGRDFEYEVGKPSIIRGAAPCIRLSIKVGFRVMNFVTQTKTRSMSAMVERSHKPNDLFRIGTDLYVNDFVYAETDQFNGITFSCVYFRKCLNNPEFLVNEVVTQMKLFINKLTNEKPESNVGRTLKHPLDSYWLKGLLA